jgi:hypothetical protein
MERVCLYGRVIHECVNLVIWYGLHGWHTVYFFFMLYISSAEKSDLSFSTCL